MLPMFLTGSSFRIASPTTALQTHCLCGCSSLSGTDLCTEDVEHSLFSGRRLRVCCTNHTRPASILRSNETAFGMCPCPSGRRALIVPSEFLQFIHELLRFSFTVPSLPSPSASAMRSCLPFRGSWRSLNRRQVSSHFAGWWLLFPPQICVVHHRSVSSHHRSAMSHHRAFLH